MPLHLTCLSCGNPILIYPSALRPQGNYCSIRCAKRQRPIPAAMLSDGITAKITLLNRNGETVGHTLIDASDVDFLCRWGWTLNAQGYAVRGETTNDGRRETVRMHRELLGLPRVPNGIEVDHINRDKLDNRRSNLRSIPHAGNMQNISVRGGLSQYRGVSWRKGSRPWRAYVQISGKTHWLGQFQSETEAAEAARAARAHLMPYAID